MTLHYDKHIQGNNGKIILVMGCVHGDELIGETIIRQLRKIILRNGTLITILANVHAMKAGRRYIDQDLNRSFPGDRNGNYEERLAHSLLPVLKSADIVLDIHSTTTDTASAIILTKVNREIRDLLKLFHPKRVVVMEKKTGRTALTGHCKAGISFEYGKDKSKEAYQETLNDILKILRASGMIVGKGRFVPKPKHITEYFHVFGVLVRPIGFKLEKSIRNFSLVRKGSIVARNGSRTQKSEQDFHPILFGKRSYEKIWGFMAKKVKRI